MKRMFAVLLVCTFVVSAYVAWSGITGREPVPIPEALGGGPNHITGTASFQDVLVTVDLFDSDQNVGELLGTVTVKPGKASSVDLIRSP